jgi:dTDP-4-dehydrorhamnose reductase
VLVLGASGMLGHKVLQILSQRFEAYGTVRSGGDLVRRVAPEARAVFEGIAASDLDGVARVFRDVEPNAVVNCIGIIKQDPAASDPVASIRVNSLFPHELAVLSAQAGARLIHVSTDCVFSGSRGRYTESDLPDATDLYGRSKLLGEVDAPALTLRTSIIGHELDGRRGLLEWFLAQRGGVVRGFRRAIFSGLSTIAFARILGDLVQRHTTLTGLWHVAATPISKHDLLVLIRDTLDLDINVDPDDSVVCDRSLDASAFGAATGIVAPSWGEMVDELRKESAFYDGLREPTVARG